MGAMKLVRIMSASPLAKDNSDNIETFFRNKYQETELYFKYETRKELVGGVLIIADGVYYDATVKAQLRQIEDLL